MRLGRPLAVLAGLGLVAASVPVSAAPSGGALPPQAFLVIHVTRGLSVPDDAIGAALNVTVTEPLAPGYLTVYPCAERPLASNVNFEAGQTVPNLVVTALDQDGDVCIATTATTDIVVDLAGYVPAGSPMVPLAAPQRFLDTREGLGAARARVPGLSVIDVPLAGGFGVPADAKTVVFNATAVQPSAAGFLTVFPCGQSIPETSTLNFAPGKIVPNLVVSAVGAGGRVCFFSNVETDIVADVAAYVPAGAEGFTTLDRPHRLVDTRIGLGGPTEPIGPPNRPVTVAGLHGVPGTATAAVVNLTATNASGPGFAAAFPCGGTVPLVSNLNFTAGTSSANLAIVKLASDGTLCLTANRAVDAVVDVLGYTEGIATFAPLTPARIYDSREGFSAPCNIGVRINGSVPELIDLTTGLSRPLHPPPFVEGWLPRAFVGPDCIVYVVRSSLVVGGGPLVLPPPNTPNTYEYDRAGTLLRSYVAYGPAWEVATPYGLVQVIQGSQPPLVIWADTREVLFELPDMGRTTGPYQTSRLWYPIGVTADGSMFAMRIVAPDGIEQMVGYFAYDGEQLGLFPMPGATPVSMSPDGVYLASVVGRGSPSQSGIKVTTLTGEFIAQTVPGGVWSEAPFPMFAGFGSVYGCLVTDSVPGGAAMRWDLFSDPRPLIAGQTAPCLLAAG